LVSLTEALGGAVPSNRIVVVGSHPELMAALVDLIAEEGSGIADLLMILLEDHVCVAH
jgi:hypothetical protein